MTQHSKFELLEKRLLYSVTMARTRAPSTGVTNTDRQAIINEWQRGHEKHVLQSALNADIAANDGGSQFDAALLNYMTAQFDANSHYFFQPGDVAADIQLIQDPSDIHAQPYSRSWQDVMANAEQEINHVFGGVSLGANINWLVSPKSQASNTGFIHSLNQMGQLVDFATAYRLQPMDSYTDCGDSKWVNEIQSELVSWSQQEPPLANPNNYGNVSPDWWLLDTADRALNLEETYALLIGTPAFTPVLNTLFMKEFFLHGQFLSTVTPKGATSNWDVSQGAALDELSLMFPEFSAAGQWHSVAINNLLVPALKQQFFADGGQVEQSPGYAKDVLGLFGDVYALDSSSLPSNARKILLNAANAYYQILEPDGTQPTIGDTVPAISSDILGPLQIQLGITSWSQAKIKMAGVFTVGAAAALNSLNDYANPTLTGRPQDVALTTSGNYILRSSEDNADSRQLIFQAGPTAPVNDAHGHLDLLSFDLYGYGQALIADPGVENDDYTPGPERNRVISTPAANTISVNGQNHRWVTPADASQLINVNQWNPTPNSTQVTAQQTAYQGVSGVSGNPVLTRSIWYDNNSTYLVVDWATASSVNKYTVGYNLVGPTAHGPNGGIHTTNSNGNNVLVVPVLSAGQSTHRAATTVYLSSPTAATQYTISQTSADALFASVIVTYQGSTPPNVTAQWQRLPGRKPGILNVLVNGVVTQTAEFSSSGSSPGGRSRVARPGAARPGAIPTAESASSVTPWSTLPLSPFDLASDAALFF